MTPYKGYTATVRFEADDRMFHGRLDGIRDVIHFAGETVDELERAFRDSVDEYLAWAAEDGFEPQRPNPQPSDDEARVLVERAARLDGQSVDRWSQDVLTRAAKERLRQAG